MYKCKNSRLLLMGTNNDVARRYIHRTCTNYLSQTVECSSRGIPSSSIASFASYKKQRRWEGELPSQRPAPCFPAWTWVRVKVPVGVGGVRRLAPVDRQSALGPGDVWRQSSGRLRGEGTSCEAICSDRADRRSNAEMYCTLPFFPRRHRPVWLYMELVVIYRFNYFCYSIFAVIDIVVWVFGEGRGGEVGGVKDLSPSCRVCDRTWWVRVTSNLFPWWEIDEKINLFSGKQKASPSAAS